MRVNARTSLFAEFMLLLCVLAWAAAYPIGKVALGDWGGNKFLFLAVRFWLALAVFAPFAMKRFGWRRLLAHSKPGLWGGITVAATLGCLYEALGLGSSAEVALITALSSVLVPVGMWLAFRQRVNAITWIGLVIATAGVILVGVKSSFSIDSAAVLASFAAAGMAANIILIDYFMTQKDSSGTQKYNKVPFITMQFLFLAMITTLLSVSTENISRNMQALSANGIVRMLFLSVIATAGAFFFQTKYQPMTKPDRAALLYTLDSPIAGLFGYLILGDAFTPRMLLGAVMIVAAVISLSYNAASSNAMLRYSRACGIVNQRHQVA